MAMAVAKTKTITDNTALRVRWPPALVSTLARKYSEVYMAKQDNTV